MQAVGCRVPAMELEALTPENKEQAGWDAQKVLDAADSQPMTLDRATLLIDELNRRDQGRLVWELEERLDNHRIVWVRVDPLASGAGPAESAPFQLPWEFA